MHPCLHMCVFVCVMANLAFHILAKLSGAESGFAY